MPQLDVSTYLPQLVWLAITFVALLALMTWVGLPPVGAALERRRAKIDGDLNRAQEARNEAETVMAAFERSLAEARASAQETVRQAIDRLHAEAEQRQRETSRVLQEEIAAAEQRIVAARTAALGDLRGVASDVARAVSQKLTGLEVAAEDAGAAVDAILRERA